MDASTSRIHENVSRVRGEIEQAAREAGRDPADVLLIAVSKATTTGNVARAIECGVTNFGENRIPGLDEKQAAFPAEEYPDIAWHFIGSLQTNKVKHVVGRVAVIHSVDSLRLLEKIDQVGSQKGVIQRVLLQVNISGEESKHGLSVDEVISLIQVARQCRNVKIEGLMTMAPAGSLDTARDVFWRLFKLRELLREQLPDGVELNQLSMGMSSDFTAAVAEGATMVRVGQTLFT